MRRTIPACTLTTGETMPMLGFGTWGLDNAETAITWALEAGYRHIDTAKIYGTESAVAAALAASDVPREEVFITTKLWNADQGYQPALDAIEESLDELQTDYVDLYLIHWPFTNETTGENLREETWTAMEEIFETGKARSIGVSNYLIEHLEEMATYAKVPPAVNQVEFHPLWYRKELMEYCHEHSIVVTNYSPLARTVAFDEPVLQEIAAAHNKSPAQVMLRWGIHHGNIVIPKSSVRDHIRKNINIFDFRLTDDEIARIDGINQDRSVLGTQF